MTQEDFCSFEVAQLLKEKGFDELCIFKYSSEGVRMKAGVAIDEWQNSELDDDEYSCVSHQMAMKWLSGKGVECVVIPIWNTIGKQYRSYVLSDLGDKYKDNYDSYSDNIHYEEAVEAALKYALENLL